MPDLELVDYGGGNLGSLKHCLHRLDLDFRILGPGEQPSGDRPLVLPGVGAFGAVAEGLQRARLTQSVVDSVKAGTPFLGICVGLQILLEGSEESPEATGLGLIPGRVVKFHARKVPQIGWNLIESRQEGWPSGFVYFVNSYYAAPYDPAVVWYEADYHGKFCAAIRYDNVSAFQFHPEKSGEFGQELLRRWYEGAV